MKTSIFAVIAVVLVALAVVLLWYLRKSMLFSKGNYGKKTVKSILNRYAISRNYKVLENVQLQLDGKTQTIDFVRSASSDCCLFPLCRARVIFTATSRSLAGALWMLTTTARSALTTLCWKWTKRSTSSAA